MFSSYFLQIEGGILSLIIIALIIIIPTAVLLSRRKAKPIDNTGIGLLQQQIDTMKNEYGEKINSIPAMDVIQDLEGRMEGINDYVIDTHEKDSRERIEKFTEIKDEMEKDMKERIVAQAKKVISESSVSRQEFKDIERRLDKFVGDDTQEEKVELLSKLFNSQKISVISWKCKMIQLLRNGVAPQIDVGKFVLSGIPPGESKKFLKDLMNDNIVDKREIDSYTISEEYLWMEQYVDKPVWLNDEFVKRDLKAKKEKEYQNWMKDNLDKIEDDLMKENRESRMKEGTIDFLCRDVDGKLVGLELKFPKATQKDAKQLIGYAEGIQKHEHEENFRGIMVAPEIPDGLKDLLKEHELEYKEVPWNDEDNNIEEEKNSDVDIDRTIISKNEDTPVDASLD
tara:strand:- start:146 stop:1336 length:1191 start_codon:yes stop_codon:yes gene_type:complete